ncbi:tyrosine-type recombinase/integrase [Lactiplantibacillus xiangfangensis]|uniref:tyrosine-type recombinase/integrase n=1 Tax=Lactiplantibacillus xiangfangensis TaxID=942150 RepID=UPI00384D69C4
MASSYKITEIQLKSGKVKYQCVVYVGLDPATGKRKHTTIRKDSYKETELAVHAFIADRDKGKLATGENMTFKQVYDEWHKQYAKRVKPSTLYNVDCKYRKNILPYFQYYQMKKITPAICQNMVNEVAKHIKSVHEMKAYANLIFKHAMKYKYISKNPMEFVEVPKDPASFYWQGTQQINRKYWLKSEVKQFLKIAQAEFNFYDYVMFRLLLFSGMRKGEMQGLNWSDLDMDSGELKIDKTLSWNKSKQRFELQAPKTVTSNRVIIIDPITIGVLKQWKIEQKKELLALGRTNKISKPDYPMFMNMRETYFPLSHLNDVLQYNFYKYHPAFHKINVHGLRHTHASLLFEAGASLKDVQSKLGHKDIQTTMNIYTHVTETKRQKTQDKFANFMGF